MMKFLHLLQKPTSQRTEEDIDALLSYLRSHKALSSLSESALRTLCHSIRYAKYPANSLVFCRQDLIASWYILLSGSVFVDGRMYIADDSFGKRISGELFRSSDCIVSEPSEMMVIDYLGAGNLNSNQTDFDCVEGKKNQIYLTDSAPPSALDSQNRFLRYSDSSLFDQQNTDSDDMRSGAFCHVGHNLDHCYLGSKASDTSSLCSGSDVMLSSTDEQPIDLTGLIESIVDSDDEDDDDDDPNFGGHDEENLSVHDAFRECLEKSPDERTDKDVTLILDNIQHLPAFNNITLATRQALCRVMRIAVVDALHAVVMTDGEEIDSWSVILNGEVETTNPDSSVKVLKQGESFGLVTPTSDKVYHQGVMKTKVANCQFLCIAQDDYCLVMQQGEENIKSVEENSKIVLKTEERLIDDNKKVSVVIQGTPEKLLELLISPVSSADPTFIEDFLLTYRTFLESPLVVADKLLHWFNYPAHRQQVVSIVHEWLNSHYSDFEPEPRMMDFLEQLQQGLEELGMIQQLKQLSMTCTAKSKPRTLILNRTERKEVLHFAVLGGMERGCGIYISKVEKGSKAHEIGLKRGDQILEVNNQKFERISHTRALEILRSTTHLSITVKSNLLGFKEMLSTPSRMGSRKESKSWKAPLSQMLSEPHQKPPFSSKSKPVIIRGNKEEERSSFLSGGNKSKLRQALMKLNILPKSLNSEANRSQPASRKGSTSGGSSPLVRTRFSSSHPDLSTLKLCSNEMITQFPDYVLKIFQDDQSFRYLMIFKETTAREVVMLALQEFGITTPASSNYSLCEVTVLEEGFVKQRRLPDQMSNLADRCGLNSRYYLKCNDRTDPLIPDEVIGEVLRENQMHFLSLDCAEVAAQLTIKDFQIFRDVQPTEYVVDLLKCSSKYGTPNLTRFSELSNSEMFWVITQICSETSLNRRTKTMKHFIQIAKHCQECKNFNSLFAIISGLGHGSVQRLKQTWDKLPSKYLRLFEDLQKLMDPTRNMSKYRILINSLSSHPPLIPFFPLVKKDLTFIHLGNDSVVNDLVNFEKLRMIAKEVRHVCNMAPAYSDMNTSISASAAALIRKKYSGMLQSNPRKMYEEMQMVRRVRAYLNNYKTIEDENILDEMSNHCEPSAYGLMSRKLEVSNSNPVVLMKQTPVNLGPKFGADSPDAVHKLMQLSDRVRPHESRRQKLPVSVSVVPGRQSQPVLLHPSTALLSSEASSVVGHNHVQRQSSVGKELTVGSASNSPTNSIGSNAGRRLMQSNQPKRSESDSGHNSSSNCDSNSASSFGSAGSPTSTKAKQRVSSMRQYGQPFGQSSGTLQNSRSIFYVSSTSDLRQTSKMGQGVCPTAVVSRSSRARTMESDVGLNEKVKMRLSESHGAAPKEAPTHRRANSSPLRLAETVKPEDADRTINSDDVISAV